MELIDFPGSIPYPAILAAPPVSGRAASTFAQLNKSPVMHRLTVSVTIILGLLGFAASAEPPRELVSLRESYQKARQQALSPLDKKYVDALTALKTRFTKEGNLEAALAVDSEIKSISSSSSASTPAAPAQSPASDTLSRKEREKLEASLAGNWRLASGGFFRIGGSALMYGGKKIENSIAKDGSISAVDQDGKKALLRLSSDGSTLAGTWFTGVEMTIQKEASP